MVELRARRNDGERGASLVEFALVVPLLTLFLFGIVQFGVAYDMKQSINSAAREGARTASLPTSNFSAIDTSVRSGFQGLDEDGSLKVTVTAPGYSASKSGSGPVVGATSEPCKNNAGSNVVVLVETEHTLTIPFFGAPEITIDGRGEFRCEAAV